MPRCIQCSIDIESEVAYHDHLLVHKIEAANTAIYTYLQNIYTQLAIMNILTIRKQYQKHISYEDACWTIHEIGEAMNKVLKTYVDKGMSGKNVV